MSEEVERRLAILLRQDAMEEFTKLAMNTYGPELYGFLVHLMLGSQDAADVYQETSENFCRSSRKFRGECSVRTWLYVLARNAHHRYQRSQRNHGRHTGDSRLNDFVAFVRSRTEPWRRTEVKDRWQTLLESLDPDDRTLLVLRIDRDLEWNDIARILLEGTDSEPTATMVGLAAGRLRKRFQTLKGKLRDLAHRSGLVEEQ